ncbi:alpha/beta hydrolase family esterase [Micromonospora sp. WMMD558]|uniref:extracellular catalytic domain type 1 short-chain-length polyhydroxyalkanoate depolymerase n=1 Tax=unclassified Micromonospora TaxID=2617518 RepID=UPI0012B49516|nr:PHB depolymerase family esterase [Micromonospora sp. WMMC415]QGN48067.1 PHB depolymerase family esterase [Micromonospora sp. WMMC415]
MTSPSSAPDTDAEPTRPLRRRWLRIVSGVLATVVAAVSLGVAALQLGLPWQMGDGDRNHVYEGDAGSQRYQVHLPPQHKGTTRLPVIMAIHGCGMTGYGWNSMKSTTQFNRLADREGFIVVYPTQLITRNLIACWNSANPRHQHRYTGEPALLAGVARQVVEKYDADPARVHVAGASSGAGTAVILAATHPDIFATVTSVAGGEYGLNQVDPDDPDSTSPLDTARQAWAQMGDRARRVPLLVIQGERDEVVPPLVATRLVEHWTAVGDLVDDGLPNDSLDTTEKTVSMPAAAGRHAYTQTTISAPDGSSIVEAYRVQDMGHVWPGPDGDGRYTDHAGPDASAIVWEFAERHPMA